MAFQIPDVWSRGGVDGPVGLGRPLHAAVSGAAAVLEIQGLGLRAP